MRAEEGHLTGGLPYVAVGGGPPLVVLNGLSAEHGPPSRMERQPPLRTFGRPFQRAFRVRLVSRRAGLPPGTTMADLAEHVAVAGRTAQRLLAERTLAGRHRAAWSALAPMLATGRAGRVAFTAMLWACGPLSSPDDPNDMVATIRAEGAFDAEAELGRVAAPTLVIGGEHDGFYSPELFAATARGIPGAQLLLRPRGTHISVLRDHEVQLALARFLR